MKKNNIVILTGLVRSGKTTLLLKWMENQRDSRGVLTPDIDGIRFFMHYPERKLIKMQIVAGEEKAISVGRFLFSKDSFDEVNNLIIQDINSKDIGWVVIDEIGILELRDNGLCPAFRYALDKSDKNILIVVRTKLLKRVIEKFDLQDAKVIFKEELEKI